MLFLTFPCDNKSTYSYANMFIYRCFIDSLECIIPEANMFIYRCFIDSLECIIPETYCTYYIRY